MTPLLGGAVSPAVHAPCPSCRQVWWQVRRSGTVLAQRVTVLMDGVRGPCRSPALALGSRDALASSPACATCGSAPVCPGLPRPAGAGPAGAGGAMGWWSRPRGCDSGSAQGHELLASPGRMCSRSWFSLLLLCPTQLGQHPSTGCDRGHPEPGSSVLRSLPPAQPVGPGQGLDPCCCSAHLTRTVLGASASASSSAVVMVPRSPVRATGAVGGRWSLGV